MLAFFFASISVFVHVNNKILCPESALKARDNPFVVE